MFGVTLIIPTLALVALSLMTQESRLAEHKIKRMRAFFAAQAGMVHGIEELRKGNVPSSITIGAGETGYPSAGYTVDISYVNDNSGPNQTDPLTISVNY